MIFSLSDSVTYILESLINSTHKPFLVDTDLPYNYAVLNHDEK